MNLLTFKIICDLNSKKIVQKFGVYLQRNENNNALKFDCMNCN